MRNPPSWSAPPPPSKKKEHGVWCSWAELEFFFFNDHFRWPDWPNWTRFSSFFCLFFFFGEQNVDVQRVGTEVRWSVASISVAVESWREAISGHQTSRVKRRPVSIERRSSDCIELVWQCCCSRCLARQSYKKAVVSRNQGSDLVLGQFPAFAVDSEEPNWTLHQSTTIIQSPGPDQSGPIHPPKCQLYRAKQPNPMMRRLGPCFESCSLSRFRWSHLARRKHDHCVFANRCGCGCQRKRLSSSHTCN